MTRPVKINGHRCVSLATVMYLMYNPQRQLTNTFSCMMMERKPRAAMRAKLSKYEDSPFSPQGTQVIGYFLITLAAIVNFLSRPFGSLEVISMTHLSPVDWVLYTSLAWQWWMAEVPLIFSGLSMMKLPFHTMERSTARSLIFTPSYMYWKAETESEGVCGKWTQSEWKSKTQTEDRVKKKKDIEKDRVGKMRGWKGSRETRLLTICHLCHGCLLLSFLTCRDANPGWGGQSSTSEENGLFIHCHRVARYALHWNLASDLHCANQNPKPKSIHLRAVTVCWVHHIYALWTPRTDGHLSVPFLSILFLSILPSVSLSSSSTHALHFSSSLSLPLSSTFSSVCSTPRAVFTDVPYVPCLHSIQAVCLI